MFKRVLRILTLFVLFDLNISLRRLVSSSNQKTMKEPSTSSIVKEPSTLSIKSNDHSILYGMKAIQRLLAKALYTESPILRRDTFITWAKAIVNRKLVSNLNFRYSVDVRELRRKHKDVLNCIETELLEAEETFKKSSNYERIIELERKMKGFKQAIDSMQKVLSYRPNLNEDDDQRAPKGSLRLEGRRYISMERYKALQELYPLKVAEMETIKRELDDLIIGTEEYGLYHKNLYDKSRVFSELGLEGAIDEREKYRKQDGQYRHNSGYKFEDKSSLIVNSYLLPILSTRYNVPIEKLIVIRNFKLDIACMEKVTTEFDFIVVVKEEDFLLGKLNTEERLSSDKNKGACRVLAAVESKANVDDIGEAFQSYNRALIWLCGLRLYYDPLLRKTKTYPNGHFEKPFHYTYNNGNILTFTSRSFSDTMISNPEDIIGLNKNEWLYSFFIKSVFFVTKEGEINNVPSKHSSWALNYIATSTSFDMALTDEEALEDLRQRLIERVQCRSNTTPSAGFTTFEMLKLYERLDLPNQIFVVPADGSQNELTELES